VVCSSRTAPRALQGTWTPLALGWDSFSLAVSDFNSWASRHKLHLCLLGTEQHQPGCSWATSLHRAALRCTTQSWSPQGPPQLPDCAILHQHTGQFVAVVREPHTQQWYVIDPKEWDLVSDVPRCMPMNNPCVRDAYTGTIHLFLNPRSLTCGHPPQAHTLLLTAAAIQRHPRAINTGSQPLQHTPSHVNRGAHPATPRDAFHRITIRAFSSPPAPRRYQAPLGCLHVGRSHKPQFIA
jgi:hypothetical protein